MIQSSPLTEEELDKLLQWISPLEPQKRHHYIKSNRFENAGNWFLKTPEFDTWCNGDGSSEGFSPLLACYGIPGTGKSVLRSVVISVCFLKLEIYMTQITVTNTEPIVLLSSILYLKDPFLTGTRTALLMSIAIMGTRRCKQPKI
jgi:hypothetical protein